MKRYYLGLFLTALCLFSAAPSLLAVKSNRNEVRADLSNGYQVIWGKNFTEADYAYLTAAIASSVSSGSPTPFLTYLNLTVSETTAKISAQLPEVREHMVKQWIVDSLRTKRLISYNGIRIEAGFATYNRWEETIYHEPYTYECKIKGPFGTWTTGVCTGMDQKTRITNLPNHNQVFLRFRFVPRSTPPTPASTHFEILYKNSCNKSLWTAIQYLDDNGQWVGVGFWGIEPGQTVSVARTKNSVIAVWARTQDDSLRWTGNHNVVVRDDNLAMTIKNITRNGYGSWTESFSCN